MRISHGGKYNTLAKRHYEVTITTAETKHTHTHTIHRENRTEKEEEEINCAQSSIIAFVCECVRVRVHVLNSVESIQEGL